MKFPVWFSPVGLVMHAGVGLAATVLLALLKTPPPGIVVALIVAGLLKEQAEDSWSDFRPENGGPWNGLLDVVTFLPAAIAWWVIA